VTKKVKEKKGPVPVDRMPKEKKPPAAEPKIFVLQQNPDGNLNMQFRGFPNTVAGFDEAMGWSQRLIKHGTVVRLLEEQAQRDAAEKNGKEQG
jgi:hypothetical protein